MSYPECGAEMPRYKSHKIVWALKIKNIVAMTAEEFVGSDGPTPDGAVIYPEEAGYAPFSVDQAYVNKHNPQIGGYYVAYRDGYKSWSPASEFEDGYTRV